jgi:hypothetical protein
MPVGSQFRKSSVTRIPPSYFAHIEERTRQRWEQLEKDPELAGPWRQLFNQVQSPRHVLSELLQNADDAGAHRVWVRIEDNEFVFEHDGDDFCEPEFSSLCGFGFSNKRHLHTIGFRGIGFKSTFSLGDEVFVYSPTLSVRFGRTRFTQPVWVETGPTLETTMVRVPIKDGDREKELRENFKQWIESPVSLLTLPRF